MIYRKYIFIFLFLFSCSTNNVNNKDTKIIEYIDTFSTKGFALIYNDDLYKKKILVLIYNSFSILSFNVHTAKANLKDRFHFKIIS